MEHIIAKLVQDFEQGKMTRRQLVKSLALTATAAASGVGTAAAQNFPAKATAINHVSMQVGDYNRSRDFYASLFGMKVVEDNRERKQSRLQFGDNILLVRNRTPAPPVAVVDHISYTLADWGKVKPVIERELNRRGYVSLPMQTTGGGPALAAKQIRFVIDEATGPLGSFHFLDPDGYHVQIGGETQ